MDMGDSRIRSRKGRRSMSPCSFQFRNIDARVDGSKGAGACGTSDDEQACQASEDEDGGVSPEIDLADRFKSLHEEQDAHPYQTNHHKHERENHRREEQHANQENDAGDSVVLFDHAIRDCRESQPETYMNQNVFQSFPPLQSYCLRPIFQKPAASFRLQLLD
ncbi:hypothetical protein [Rhizobium sp. C4]|uniref:hypothetical protein n=1 Tax=Rhizobium sp. C4 TaxID=1349800 RepID=UPI001E461BEA|nr:hypothetical protein [Rhizobium sp. C4]MCD2175884.1 hypothetical protein [Rhizobium sp. C4]